MPLASRAVSDTGNETPSADGESSRRRETERRALRPFRIAVYALYLAFAVTFIALVARSVWLDLYGDGPVRGLRTEHPSVEACVDELERLFGKLASRSAFPTTPTELRDWDEFSRDFEDRLDLLQSKCVTDEASPAEAPVRAAIKETADHLESWRQHLSRCGEEGEEERAVLVNSIADLRRAAKRAL